MNSRERLKEYIENDQIYKEWLSGKLKNPSDFDKYCIQHCEDIETLLRESKPFGRYQENGIKSKEDRRQYIFAQLRSLLNSTQYAEVTKYIEELEQQTNLYFLLGKYLNGYKIIKIEKDPFIKEQINLWTNEWITRSFGDKSIVKFYIRPESNSSKIYKELIDKEVLSGISEGEIHYDR